MGKIRIAIDAMGGDNAPEAPVRGAIDALNDRKDSISLILDDGCCFVGDLEPLEYAEAYENNRLLKKDWDRILSFAPKTVFFAHRPEKNLASF